MLRQRHWPVCGWMLPWCGLLDPLNVLLPEMAVNVLAALAYHVGVGLGRGLRRHHLEEPHAPRAGAATAGVVVAEGAFMVASAGLGVALIRRATKQQIRRYTALATTPANTGLRTTSAVQVRRTVDPGERP